MPARQPAGNAGFRPARGLRDDLNVPAYTPARGDYVRIVLDPRTGREQSGKRPALVQNHRFLRRTTVGHWKVNELKRV